MPVGRLLAAGDTLSISIFIQDVVSVDDVFVPSDYALHPPYPNPFNPGQPSGIYFARIRAGQFETSEKISLLK